jgi:biopolymer transport protein ExbB/TolQ
MGLLTNVFYLISTSLLIPVMLALVWGLMRVLLLVGRTLREYRLRARLRLQLVRFAAALEEEDADLPELPGEGPLAECLARLTRVAGNPVLADKLIREMELRWQGELERLRGLVRNGPALGLMGTLIPLGPALVGLAAGDLKSMADNLIIAFATTVVGLLVAMLAGSLWSIKKGWYQADSLLVTFAADRLAQLRSVSLAHDSPSTEQPHTNGHRCRCAGGNAKELVAVGNGHEEEK